MARSGGAVVLASVLCASVSRAQSRPRVDFRYERPASLARCPGEDDVRGAIAGRLGFVPFNLEARTRVVLSLAGSRGAIEARVAWRDREDRVLGERVLRAGVRDCRELIERATLAICVAIDALPVLPDPPPAPPLPTPPAPPPPAPPPVLPALPVLPTPVVPALPAPPRERPWGFRAGVTVSALGGIQPDLALGFSLDLGLRWRRFTLSVEGRYDLPASVSDQLNRVARSTLLTASLAPCVDLSPRDADAIWSGCVVLTPGWLSGRGEGVDHPREATAFGLWAGARAGLEFKLHPRVGLRLRAELGAAIIRPSVSLDGSVVWESSPVYGGASAGVVVRIQ